MSMIIDGTNGLTFNNATTQASAGSVIQVVNATSTGSGSTNSTSFVSSGLVTASIIPKFSTSKILVMYQTQMFSPTAGSSVYLTIYRNATTNLANAGTGSFAESSINQWTNGTIVCVDSPATTSSTTYALYLKSVGGSSYVGGSTGDTTTITLMEIAG